MERIYTLETEKEAHHFSCAHMATFADGSAERLHGHNYRVGARLCGRLDGAGMVLDVVVFKRIVRALCDELDEHVLAPLENPLIRVAQDDKRVTMDFEDRHYEFPREDCVLLPVENTTMEHLAAWLADRLAERLLEEPGCERMETLTVSVSETPGQRAGWTLDLKAFRAGAKGVEETE